MVDDNSGMPNAILLAGPFSNASSIVRIYPVQSLWLATCVLVVQNYFVSLPGIVKFGPLIVHLFHCSSLLCGCAPRDNDDSASAKLFNSLHSLWPEQCRTLGIEIVSNGQPVHSGVDNEQAVLCKSSAEGGWGLVYFPYEMEPTNG